MKRVIPRLLIVYGASLSVTFGVALIPDYAALINAVEQGNHPAGLVGSDSRRSEAGRR